MASFIAFLIALSLGTATYQQQTDFPQQEQIEKFSKDDGIGMGEGGNQATEDPKDRP